MLIRPVFAVALALLCAACSEPMAGDDDPPTLRDQSGAEFGWSCDGDFCEIEALAESPTLPHCSEPSRAGFSYVWGVYMEVTAACIHDDGWGWLPEWGRFVVCEEDAECPTIRSWAGVDTFVCRAGYCKNTEYEEYFDDMPGRRDMSLLCFGDQSRYTTFDEPEMLAVIEAACPESDSPCLYIPDGCPDPRG